MDLDPVSGHDLLPADPERQIARRYHRAGAKVSHGI
jgi:hypothetical protein